MGNKEQKFYSALEDLFVGAKLEGQIGYVLPLMGGRTFPEGRGIINYSTKEG